MSEKKPLYTAGEVRALIGPVLGLDPDGEWDYFITAGEHGAPVRGASSLEDLEVQIVFLANTISITSMKMMHDRMVESGEHICDCDKGEEDVA